MVNDKISRYFLLRFSETFSLPISEFNSKEIKLNLFRNNKFDGILNERALKIDYSPLDRNAFDVILINGEITTNGNNKVFNINYKMSKTHIYIFLFGNLAILLFYFLDFLNIIDSNEMSDSIIPLFYPIITYLALVFLFYFYLDACRENFKKLLKT